MKRGVVVGNRELSEKLLGPCGTYCELCPFYQHKQAPSCPGCGSLQGRPFWGACKLYACVVEHGVEHCGLCQEFPCDLFVDQYDPKHGQKSAFLRVGLLAYRKKAGTKKYLEMVTKLGQV
jgi:hypothetical protein